MERLSIYLYSKTPFSIAASRYAGNVQESLDFIPGTLLRGAIAAKWLIDNKMNDFKEIFTGDKVVFGNQFINDSKPIPLSTFSCKYYGGFKGDNDKHGVVDIVLPLIREIENKILIPKQFQECKYREHEKNCTAPMKKYSGYYSKNNISYRSEKVNKRLIFHTAISPVSEAALENSLYSQEVIEKDQVFNGEILIYDNAFSTKLFDFINENEVIIGSDKSTGLGRFEIRVLKRELEDKRNIEKLKGRIQKFNKILNLNNGKTYFSITLQSDAIITNRFMQFKTFIEEEDLGIKKAKLLHGIVKTRLVQGWNSMAKLPKEDAIAIEKGSVFFFHTDDLENILNRLFEAETKGIGNRKGEGFGRLTVCDPFHFQEDII